MFLSNKTSFTIWSNSLETSLRMPPLIISTKNYFFFFHRRGSRLYLFSASKITELHLLHLFLTGPVVFSLSICTGKVCDSCLSDWTFQVFHLQFACHVAKPILTHFRVDAFLLNCTYCFFAFQSEGGGGGGKRETWIFRQVHWYVDANNKPAANSLLKQLRFHHFFVRFTSLNTR